MKVIFAWVFVSLFVLGVLGTVFYNIGFMGGSIVLGILAVTVLLAWCIHILLGEYIRG